MSASKLERFLDPYFYVSKRELVSHLTFEVTMWRARVQDEESRQLCATQNIRWGERRPGPRDLCNMAKDSRHDDTIYSFLSTHQGNTAHDRLEQWLTAPYHDLPAMENPEADAISATTTLHVFTRTEQDGFVNADELECEVHPPMEPTPLALLEVYGSPEMVQARTGNAGASGKPTPGTAATPGAQAGADTADPASPATAAAGGANGGAAGPGTSPDVSGVSDQPAGGVNNRRDRFYILAAEGAATFKADTPPAWRGREMVLTTLQELSDGQFIAKPSLGETHVLKVDDEFVVSYRVSLVGHEHHDVHRPVDEEPANRSFVNAAALASRSIATKSTVPPELQSEALEKQRRVTILRQLVATTGHIPRSSAGPSVDTDADAVAKFTLPPPSSARQRVHFFGTVESSEGLEHTSAFLKLEFVLPISGFEIDADVNRKSGVAFRPELVSQTAVACRYRTPENIYVTGHHFNMPFELHGIADLPTPVVPRVVVSAWSQESESRQALLGYGVLTLAPQPGMHRKTIDLWHPTLYGRETLRSVFVGGSVSLVDAESAAIPYEQRVSNLRALAEEVDITSQSASLAVNSRAGMMSKSQGSITVQWMCATQKRASAGTGAFAAA
eukprot:CAMPEP_0174869018 /NCGR_PEP_ID=MMETSP1114-20130205/67102_1 /TAXON_ID=312471 /ORGANISM="Neobodo designis, Strain CCAP 1951/1" /LENGTH=615 /DNA_ID=CAMNT_0016104251 /DNA_START=42 /DNA_END=1885 /DNA_ORIENTATION=-